VQRETARHGARPGAGQQRPVRARLRAAPIHSASRVDSKTQRRGSDVTTRPATHTHGRNAMRTRNGHPRPNGKTADLRHRPHPGLTTSRARPSAFSVSKFQQGLGMDENAYNGRWIGWCRVLGFPRSEPNPESEPYLYKVYKEPVHLWDGAPTKRKACCVGHAQIRGRSTRAGGTAPLPGGLKPLGQPVFQARPVRISPHTGGEGFSSRGYAENGQPPPQVVVGHRAANDSSGPGSVRRRFSVGDQRRRGASALRTPSSRQRCTNPGASKTGQRQAPPRALAITPDPTRHCGQDPWGDLQAPRSSGRAFVGSLNTTSPPPPPPKDSASGTLTHGKPTSRAWTVNRATKKDKEHHQNATRVGPASPVQRMQCGPGPTNTVHGHFTKTPVARPEPWEPQQACQRSTRPDSA